MSADLPRNLRPDAFAGVVGVVDDYVRYRLPYPSAMLGEMLDRAALAPDARLLDLACGPGRLTLPIAARFADVLAVDQDAEMVSAGQRLAADAGVNHIRWQVGRAEDLDAPDAGFDLVTAAEAFHRFDRRRVAALAFGWLKPGGEFVTIGMGELIAAPAPWRPVVADVVRLYVGPIAQRWGDAPSATPPPTADLIADEESVLRQAGFDPVQSVWFEVPHAWSLEAFLGNLRSTSILSRHALGARHAAFEADLAAALRAFDASERYEETVRFGYTLARKPGRSCRGR
jgi:SAM-dependent methyltransferase